MIARMYCNWFLLGLVATGLNLGSSATVFGQEGVTAQPVAMPRARPRVVILPGTLPAEGAWHANHEMRLRSDGNLPGQLRSFDTAGNMVPVRGRLFFVQNNKVVAKALTDEQGNF